MTIIPTTFTACLDLFMLSAIDASLRRLSDFVIAIGSLSDA